MTKLKSVFVTALLYMVSIFLGAFLPVGTIVTFMNNAIEGLTISLATIPLSMLIIIALLAFKFDGLTHTKIVEIIMYISFCWLLLDTTLIFPVGNVLAFMENIWLGLFLLLFTLPITTAVAFGFKEYVKMVLTTK